MRCRHCGNEVGGDRADVTIGLSSRLSGQVDKWLSSMSSENINTEGLDKATKHLEESKDKLETKVQDNQPPPPRPDPSLPFRKS